MKHIRRLKVSKKVKELVMEEKSQNSHILVYQKSDGQKQLLCSYSMKEDADFIISQVKEKKLELPLKDFESYEQLSTLTIPHSISFGLKLPSVEIQKEEFNSLLSDLESELTKLDSEESKIKKI
jgi:hypothetical protein|tara:strand:+ start:939 stop:1310 length:372 start_codon:yes stop_codon:yes gene_type:complete